MTNLPRALLIEFQPRQAGKATKLAALLEELRARGLDVVVVTPEILRARAEQMARQRALHLANLYPDPDLPSHPDVDGIIAGYIAGLSIVEDLTLPPGWARMVSARETIQIQASPEMKRALQRDLLGGEPWQRRGKRKGRRG